MEKDTILVEGIWSKIRETDLRVAFLKYGAIDKVDIEYSAEKSKHAFIQFTYDSSAFEAVENPPTHLVKGSVPLRVRVSYPGNDVDSQLSQSKIQTDTSAVVTIPQTVNQNTLNVLMGQLQIEDDEQVISRLSLFRNVSPLTLFSFLSKVIRRERIGIVVPVLELVYSNPKNFTPFDETDEFEHGLKHHFPVDIHLPLEAALLRGSDKLINEVDKFYRTTEYYTDKLKNEDALRCYLFLQTNKSACPEHLRLTLMILFLEFVNIRTLKFHEIIDLYSTEEEEDVVPRVLSPFIKTIAETGSTHHLPKTFKAAYKCAETIGDIPLFDELFETEYDENPFALMRLRVDSMKYFSTDYIDLEEFLTF